MKPEDPPDDPDRNGEKSDSPEHGKTDAGDHEGSGALGHEAPGIEDADPMIERYRARLDALLEQMNSKSDSMDSMKDEHEDSARDYRKAVEFELRLLNDEMRELIEEMIEMGLPDGQIRDIILESGKVTERILESGLMAVISMGDPSGDGTMGEREDREGQEAAGNPARPGDPEMMERSGYGENAGRGERTGDGGEARQSERTGDGGEARQSERTGDGGEVGQSENTGDGGEAAPDPMLRDEEEGDELEKRKFIFKFKEGVRVPSKTPGWRELGQVKKSYIKSFRICVMCGARIPANFRICGRCGKKLGLMCNKCGGDVPEGYAYCTNCGNPMF